jgi:regulator of nucleoside diphosphate kinase
MSVSQEARPAISIAQSEYDRITSLLDGLPDARQEELDDFQEELERAELVPDAELPATVVRMNSRVTFRNETTGDTVVRRLVYPGPDTAQPDAVSIFQPAGSALIGLAVGQLIDWALPDGRHARLRVLSVE